MTSMCMECGQVYKSHTRTCSQFNPEVQKEIDAAAAAVSTKGVEAITEIILNNVMLTIEGLARDHVANEVKKAPWVTEAKKKMLVNAAVDEVRKDGIIESVVPLAVIQMFTFLFDQDLIDIVKFSEVMSFLDWTAPDAPQ